MQAYGQAYFNEVHLFSSSLTMIGGKASIARAALMSAYFAMESLTLNASLDDACRLPLTLSE